MTAGLARAGEEHNRVRLSTRGQDMSLERSVASGDRIGKSQAKRASLAIELETTAFIPFPLLQRLVAHSANYAERRHQGHRSQGNGAVTRL